MDMNIPKFVADAVKEYVAAMDALHTTHGSTNVHGGPGSIGGAAMTDHCAWTCHVVDGKLNFETRKFEGTGKPIHAAELERVYQARRKLAELGLI